MYSPASDLLRLRRLVRAEVLVCNRTAKEQTVAVIWYISGTKSRNTSILGARTSPGAVLRPDGVVKTCRDCRERATYEMRAVLQRQWRKKRQNKAPIGSSENWALRGLCRCTKDESETLCSAGDRRVAPQTQKADFSPSRPSLSHVQPFTAGTKAGAP
ncbi:hypothetical protein KL920_001639 [Ogataea angusta]|nr:hypothetical protein KL920_001639 [Ogataea angusta]